MKDDLGMVATATFLFLNLDENPQKPGKNLATKRAER
jgi:hypothetical protein